MAAPTETASETSRPQLAPETIAFYREAMQALDNAGVPFLVGGAYAFARYTGIHRYTKDFDIFVHPADFDTARRWYEHRAAIRLDVLDRHMIGGNGTWVAGESFSIADMFGAALVSIGDLAGFSLDPYPNVRRWLAAFTSR